MYRRWGSQLVGLWFQHTEESRDLWSQPRTSRSKKQRRRSYLVSPFRIKEKQPRNLSTPRSTRGPKKFIRKLISPGINDPFTAITCIDHLSSTLSYLAQIEFPSEYRYDENKNLRIVTNSIDFEGLLDTSFNQIRQFSGTVPSVTIKLMEALNVILSFTTKDEYKQAIIKHANMILENGRKLWVS